MFVEIQKCQHNFTNFSKTSFFRVIYPEKYLICRSFSRGISDLNKIISEFSEKITELFYFLKS